MDPMSVLGGLNLKVNLWPFAQVGSKRQSTGLWGRGEGGHIPKGSHSTSNGGEQGQEPQESWRCGAI